MTAELRRLLTPTDDGGSLTIGPDGRAYIPADHVANALARIDTTIARLVRDLATATGRTPDEVRVAEGIKP